MRCRACPPGARSPRSAPVRQGGACCCLALWSSEQVDRHLLPRAALGVTRGAGSSYPQRAPHMHGCPGDAGGPLGVRGLGRLGKLGPSIAHRGQSGSPELGGSSAHGHWGLLGVSRSPLLRVCPFLCRVCCASGPSPVFSLPPPSPPWERDCCVGLGALPVAGGGACGPTEHLCPPQARPRPRASGCSVHLGQRVL